MFCDPSVLTALATSAHVKEDDIVLLYKGHNHYKGLVSSTVAAGLV